MEQATTGKVPPQIAIPAGGGIMLNMNAVQRSVGMGATVVPTPASAQTAVVGSPQVPGKPQPRVISITPQMMRQQAPGGVEESERESVIQCDNIELKTTNAEAKCSPSPPASISGVYSPSDLEPVHDGLDVTKDHCENKVKEPTSCVETKSEYSTNSQVSGSCCDINRTASDNDLSRSTVPPGPVVVDDERSVSPPHSYPQQLPKQCNERSPVREKQVGNEPAQEQVPTRASCSGSPEIGLENSRNSLDKKLNGAETCSQVPPDIARPECSTSDEGALETSDCVTTDSATNQECVQSEERKSKLNCDRAEKEPAFVSVTSGNDGSGRSSSNEEPPPLVHEDAGSDLGFRGSRLLSDSSVGDPVATVDDVNLDMFSDSSIVEETTHHNSSNDNILEEYPNKRGPSFSVTAQDKNVVESKITEEPVRVLEPKSKLTDLNIADFMLMDSDEEVAVHSSVQEVNPVWNQTTSRGNNVSGLPEQTFSPPRLGGQIPSPTTHGASPVILEVSPQAWNRSKIAEENSSNYAQSPPSCAFQFYGQQQSTQDPISISYQDPIGNSPRNIVQSPTHPKYAMPARVIQSPSFNNSDGSVRNQNLTSSIQIAGPAGYSTRNLNNNIPTNYKAPDYHAQQQPCFTTDPQLYNQFVQYTKTNPLGQQDGTPESARTVSSSVSPRATATSHSNVQQPAQLHKLQSFKPDAIPQQQPYHLPKHSTSLGTPPLPRHYAVQHQHYPNLPQNSPYQYRNNSTSVNGCETGQKPVYQMPHVNTGSNYAQHRPTSQVSPQQSLSYMPMGSHKGAYYPQQVSAGQTTHLQSTSNPSMQKELSSCSYANLPGGGGVPRVPSHSATGYSQSTLNQPNYSSGINTQSAQSNLYQVGSSLNSATSHANKMSYPQQSQYPSPTRPLTKLSVQVPQSNYATGGSSDTHTGSPTMPPAGWNPPMLQGARAQLLQVLRPNAFPNQNLGARGMDGIQRPPAPHNMLHQAALGRSNYPHGSVSASHQYHHGQAGSIQLPSQQRTSSVISPRYPSPHAIHQGIPGGSSISPQRSPISSPSMYTSPLPLRSSQYLAHPYGPNTGPADNRQVISRAYNNPIVIRPGTNHTGMPQGTGPVASASNSANGNSSMTASRLYFSNGGTNRSSYLNNQASVIRAPPSSGTSTNGSLEPCTINRSSNSCIVIERNPNNHQSTTGDLTLQSYLSHPNAPFACPSSPSSSQVSPGVTERSGVGSSRGPGYYYGNVNSEVWGGASYSSHARGDHIEDGATYHPSSCQYSDGAMRRFNAPLTLQALQGLQPGVNHLLVKTENGQFQLVNVRMQSPNAAGAASGTPVVPTSVAAPPTPMSIAQQLPSNSPLVGPQHVQSPHAGPPPPMVPPIPTPSIMSTTTIPPHPSAQQGRIITSSSSNHIVTSWSSSNNNSLVNNNSTTSSPLPVISSSAAPPHAPPSPHLAQSLPPQSAAPPHHALPVPPPSSVPSSVIMPPSLSSASNSQLSINTANNNNVSSSSPSSTSYTSATEAAISAVIMSYQQNQQRAASTAAAVHHGAPLVPAGGARHPAPPPNSIPTVVAPAAGPVTNSLSQGASVIRTNAGVIGPNSLAPPVNNTPANVAVANSVISSSTSPMNLPAAPTTPATLRPLQQSNTASPLPNNNSNGILGMGMMVSPNSNLSVPQLNHQQQVNHYQQTPHAPFNQHHLPPQQVPYNMYTSSSIASSANTANTVSQMSNETAKTKCKNFLSFLLELSAKQNQTVARNVKGLIQGLIDGKVNEENFADRLQKEVNSQPQPCLVGFLKKSLPHLRHSLALNELKIEGIKPPPRTVLVPPPAPASVSALAPPMTPPTVSPDPPTPPPPSASRKKSTKQSSAVRPTTPTVPASPVRIVTPPVNSASPSTTLSTPAVSGSGNAAPPSSSPSPSSAKSSKPSKGSSSKAKSNSSSNSAFGGGVSVLSGPGGTPLSKSSIPSTSKSGKEKEKKDKTFSSGYSADDDINDVAAMGGVNLAEESQRILGSTEYVGTQIRSCRDETLIPASPIIAKFRLVAAKYGLDETPTSEVSALFSHAVEERLKTMIEKLSVIAEHRMDVIKLDDRYEITQDVKGQLRFLEELDKLEKKRHDEQEREMLIRAAKSRSKSEDPEQAKLKAKAKEMQRVALEEMRQRDANFTALQAIGPRKKPKLDMIGGSHGSAVPSPLGATGASSSLGRPQMPLRPRLKRVNLRDLLFLLEHDKDTMRSPFLYKSMVLK